MWGRLLRKCHGRQPDSGNLTVRDETGSMGKHGPWWNYEPAALTERVNVGNSPPKVACAPTLSRPADPADPVRQEEAVMKQDIILKKLAEHRDELESRFGVASLSLFGSVARDEAAAESDVDILVTFVQTPGIFGFLELKEYLEHLLQCSVDLVTRNALKKQFREQILREALHAV